MSLGRIINLRDWKNNKSGGWRETETEKEKGKRTFCSEYQELLRHISVPRMFSYLRFI
jgi:hypothetical protein